MESSKPAPNKPKSAEMNPGPGFRIRTSFERLDPDLVRRFADFDSPDISDQLNRLYALSPQIRCVTGDHTVVGLACTVKVFPGDIVVADGFGVVIVPRENAEEVLARLVAFQDKNREYFAGVKKGVFSNEWVDDVLDEGGCLIYP